MNEEYVWKEATGKLAVLDTKPNHNFTFQNQDSKQVGALDFNGPEMVFTGDADESAKVFFDYVARAFKARLDQERADERNSWPSEMEAMERQVNILTDALAQAKADEREKWAQVCDEIDKDSQSQWPKRLATMIRARTAEQPAQQEPVGEVLDERGEVDWISFVPPAGTSLYTTPSQRKPLTDEEIMTYRHMIDWTAEWSYIKFARAIEAAHGIRGEK